MAKFGPKNTANLKGCPKGAHNIGRPKDEIREECYKLATDAAPAIVARFSKIALGENTEQVVTDQGETLSVPAPVPAQIKAGEVVLTYAIHKLSERLELTGADGGPVSGVPTSAIPELIAAIRQRTADGAGSGTGEAA